MQPDLPTNLPSYDDIVRASERLAGHAHRTPVLTSATADAIAGASLFFKCENFQRMGAFVSRRLQRHRAPDPGAARRRRGDVLVRQPCPGHRAGFAHAGRAGHHHHAAGRSRGQRAATEGYGGKIVTYDRYTEDREEIARRIQAETGATLIPPYDHEDVIAGRARRPRNCSRKWASWITCSSAWAAAGC